MIDDDTHGLTRLRYRPRCLTWFVQAAKVQCFGQCSMDCRGLLVKHRGTPTQHPLWWCSCLCSCSCLRRWSWLLFFCCIVSCNYWHCYCQLLLLHLVFNNIIIRYHNSTIYHEYHHLSLLSPWISRSIDAAKQSKNDSRWKAWEGLNTVESKDTVTLWKSYGKMAHCLWKWWWFMKIVIVPFAICSSRRLNVRTCRYKGKNMLMLPLWADFHHFSGRQSWER